MSNATVHAYQESPNDGRALANCLLPSILIPTSVADYLMQLTHANPSAVDRAECGGHGASRPTHPVLAIAINAISAINVVAWAMCLLATQAGCLPPASGDSIAAEEHTWGTLGRQRGQFYKPRAITIGPDGLVYVVDKTGRIQVFDQTGEFQRGWQTPEVANGKPCGLSFDHAGQLIVADTHYHRVLRYTTKGELLDDRTLGGVCGEAEGEFSFITRAVEDSQGNLYVGEYGAQDRIQKFDANGKFLFAWGAHGDDLASFNRPQALVIDQNDHLWVVDACNHRVLVFNATGDSPQLLQNWGSEGSEQGQLRYPWDLWLEGEHVYICELGNHRIQKFTRDGAFVATWGGPGTGAGQLKQPWGVVRNDSGQMFVLDTYNHRVKRIQF